MRMFGQIRCQTGRLVRLATVAFLLSCAPDASAEWLYWTTDFGYDWGNSGEMQANPGWSGAQVWLVAQNVDNSSDRTYLADVNGTRYYTMTESLFDTEEEWIGQIAQVDISGYSDGSYVFFVEMGTAKDADYQGKFGSELMTFEDLVTAGHVAYNLEPVSTPLNAAVGAPWRSVPEPSGGMLTLMGAALLFLRRKRRRGKVAASLVLCGTETGDSSAMSGRSQDKIMQSRNNSDVV